MPTPLPPAEKQSFIDIVQYVDTYQAWRLPDTLNNYEDIPGAIAAQLTAFATNPSYAQACLSVFTAADMNAAGVWYGETTGTLSDPKTIVACTGIDIQCSSSSRSVIIIGESSVNTIYLGSSVEMGTIWIGPGALVNSIDGTASGATISRVTLNYLNSIGSTLNRIIVGSTVNQVDAPVGTFFGGFQYAPSGSCTNPIADLAASDTTHNSIKYTWTNPASSYIGLIIQYKKSDSNVWITLTNGTIIQDGGVILLNLLPDTYYDIQVITQCPNGVQSDPVQLLSTKTTCC